MSCDFRSILVAVDRSEAAKHALSCALSLARNLDARLTALALEGRLPAYAATVGEVDEDKREKDQRFGKVLEDAKARAAEWGVEIDIDLAPGYPARVITRYAEAHGHDLIIVGYRDHLLGDYLLGSTADRVAHNAHCPVMVVR